MSEEVQNRLGGSTAGVSRRTLVKSAAWSVPVVAIAVAAPAHAASTTAKYDLSAEILYPSYVAGGGSAWTWRFTSNGPDAVPAGSTITVTFTSTNIGAADYATVNLALGTNASLYSTYSPVLTQTVNHSHSSVSFVITLTAPVPAGAYFQYTGGSAWGANFDRARLTATATAPSDSDNTNYSASTPLL